MKSLIVIIAILLSATAAFANNCRVVEYQDKNEIICEGNPDLQNNKYPESPAIMRAKYLVSEIDRLSREGEEIMKLTGRESAEEIKTKRDQAAKKLAIMESYADELRRLKESSQRRLDQAREELIENRTRSEQHLKKINQRP